MDTLSAPPGSVAPDIAQAAQTFFPELTEVASIAGRPNLARISAPSGLWRVRRWPEGTPESDVAFSHQVMGLARGAGLQTVPALFAPGDGADGALRIANRLIDAQRWLPGAPPARAESAWPGPDDRIEMPVALPRDVFAGIITVLAHLHEATAALATTSGIPAAPLHLLPGAVREAQGRHLSALRAKARQEPAIQRWISTGERLLEQAEAIVLAATRDRELPGAVLHLGLWPVHVLIDDGDVSGILGWERVAAGSPLLDIAQVTLRLQGWSDDAVETALGAYADVRELAPDERRLLPAVAALDAVATTGRLLEQTHAVKETARPPSALRAAIDMMLGSMAAIERNLNVEPRKRRTWVRKEGQGRRRPKGGAPRERRR